MVLSSCVRYDMVCMAFSIELFREAPILSIGSVGASTGKNELCERFEFVDVNSYCVFRYAQ